MAAWLRGRSAGPGVRRLSLGPAAKHWNQLSESSPGPKGSQTVSKHSHASVLSTDAGRVPPQSITTFHLIHGTARHESLKFQPERLDLGAWGEWHCYRSGRRERLGLKHPITALGPHLSQEVLVRKITSVSRPQGCKMDSR